MNLHNNLKMQMFHQGGKFFFYLFLFIHKSFLQNLNFEFLWIRKNKIFSNTDFSESVIKTGGFCLFARSLIGFTPPDLSDLIYYSVLPPLSKIFTVQNSILLLLETWVRFLEFLIPCSNLIKASFHQLLRK